MSAPAVDFIDDVKPPCYPSPAIMKATSALFSRSVWKGMLLASISSSDIANTHLQDHTLCRMSTPSNTAAKTNSINVLQGSLSYDQRLVKGRLQSRRRRGVRRSCQILWDSSSKSTTARSTMMCG